MDGEPDNELRKALLLIPRSERAKAQGLRWIYEINGRTVKRDSRRYWYVGASLLKIDKAVEAVSL